MADEAIHLATAEAAVRLRADRRAGGVDLRALRPSRRRTTTAADRAGAVERSTTVNWDTGLGLFRDGVLRVPGREPVERPDLAGSFDLIGFSYYAAIGVRDGQPWSIHPPDAPISPLGYGIWADGLGLVLDRLHAELPGTPLLVAEYGIGTDDDEMRAAYLERGLEVTARRDRSGASTCAASSTGPASTTTSGSTATTSRFGIIDRDRNVRASAEVLNAAARSLRSRSAAAGGVVAAHAVYAGTRRGGGRAQVHARYPCGVRVERDAGPQDQLSEVVGAGRDVATDVVGVVPLEPEGYR